MDTTTLQPWRDLAIILLAIEAAAIVLLPGIVLFFALKGVRALKRMIRMPLLRAQVWALRIQHWTRRATNAVASVPIKVNSGSVRVRVTARSLVSYLRHR